MWRHWVVLAGLVCSAGAAHADDLYFCSADDKGERFTLEVGFDEGIGHKLAHFSGALMMKDETVSGGFRKRVFEPKNLSNHWSYDGQLFMEVLDGGEDDTGGEVLGIVVTAGQKGKTSATFSGTYALKIEGPSTSYSAEGKVSCGTK